MFGIFFGSAQRQQVNQNNAQRQAEQEASPPPYQEHADSYSTGSRQANNPQAVVINNVLYLPANNSIAARPVQRVERVVGFSTFDLRDEAAKMELAGWSFVGAAKHGPFNQILTFEKNSPEFSVIIGFSVFDERDKIGEMTQRGFTFKSKSRVNSFLVKLTFHSPS